MYIGENFVFPQLKRKENDIHLQNKKKQYHTTGQ